MLSPKELQAIEDRKPVNRQLAELQKIAEDMGKLVKMLTYTSSKTEKGMGDVGSLLMDIRESIDEMCAKEDPEQPDYAKPVVEAVAKLEKSISKAVNGINVEPKVDVKSPDVKVNVPKLDLKGVEKVLKNDIPKAFDKAIKSIPEAPEVDNTPLIYLMKELSDKLDSIDTGVRLKPLPPSSIEVSNLTDISRDLLAGVDYDYLDVQQTDTDTETFVFKTGGSGGTTVQTVVVNYTSSTKTDIDNVTWS